MKDLYRGALVRLSSASPDAVAKASARWRRDTELHRLADTDPAQLWSEKRIKERIENQKDSRAYRFHLQTLADDKLIGIIGLVPNDTCEDAWLYIAIYERDYIGKGYGSDGMKLIMQYGFLELNLRRISLGLNGYNERALRTYTKAGFQLEGRTRQDVIKDGKRYDGLFMGILREEWLALTQVKEQT
jgi:RimJ/RimL family protein N-acetyltransferase